MANVVEVTLRAKDEASRTIADLRGKLDALAKSGNPLAGAASNIAGGLEAIGPAGLAAAAGIVAVGAAAAAVSKALIDTADAGGRYADSLDDLANRTGLTTEAISGLKYAAEQSDTSIESVAQGIKFLAKNLYEARTAGSEAQKAFESIGFSAEELQSGAVDAQAALLRMADAIKDTPNQMDRIAIATKLVGRGAVEMVPFLSRGSQGIKELTDQAQAMGQVVSTSAGIVGDKYTKAILALNGSMNALKAQIAEGVLPALTDMIQFSTATVAGFGRIVKAAGDTINILTILSGIRFDKAQASFEKFLKATGSDTFLAKIHDISEQLRVLQKLADRLNGTDVTPQAGKSGGVNLTVPDTFVGPTESSDDRVTRQQKLDQDALAATEAKAKSAADELKRLQAEMLDLSRSFFALPQSIVTSLDAIGISLKDQIGLVKQFQDALKDTAKSIPTTIIKPKGFEGTPAEISQKQFSAELPKLDTTPLDEIKTKFDAGSDAGRHLVEVFERFGLSVDDLTPKLAVIGESLTGIQAIGIAMGETFNQAFTDAFDPIANSINDMGEAVGHLKDQFDAAFGGAINKILAGKASMITFTGAIEGAIRAGQRFLLELTAIVLKALILKAIGFLSGGGTVAATRAFASRGGEVAVAARGGAVEPARYVMGGSVAHFAQGGAVAQAMPGVTRLVYMASGGMVGRAPLHFAAGGSFSTSSSSSTSTSNMFSSVVHAAGGVRLVPGFPQSFDSVPAMLAPGEVVLPNVAGKSPSDLLGNLSNMSRDLSTLIARSQIGGAGPSQDGSPIVGEVHIHANDWDSVRNNVRRGTFGNELARAAELGRL